MIDFFAVKEITIPEGVVTKIVSGAKTLWEKVSFKNLLPLATDTDRKTIFNGIGYKTGVRLSSSGSVATMANMCASGFIPAVEGDILRIKGATGRVGTSSYVISYNSSNTKVAHRATSCNSAGEWSNAVTGQTYVNGVLTIPLISTYFGTGFNAIRFSAGVIDANTIVTINQEITD